MTTLSEAKFFLGARGWDLPALCRDFYPPDLPGDWRLAYYAHYFDCVLVPAPLGQGWDAGAWVADTPEGFRFLFEWPGSDTRPPEAGLAALGSRFAGVVAPDGTVGSRGGQVLWLEAWPELRGLARGFSDLREKGAEVFLVDREGDLRRLREAAALLEIMGLSQARHLD